MQNRKKGLFISFEGGEGAGKSTQAGLLASWLETQNYKTCLTREPGGTEGAECLRELLLFSGVKFSSYAEIAIHFAARIDHVQQKILPALLRGEAVICDRFYDSTFAYQGFGIEQAKPEVLKFIETIHTLMPLSPDITFLLDIPVKNGVERTQKRQGKTDRYEREKEDFHENVRQGYLKQAEKHPERIFVLNALQAPEKIQQDLREKIKLVLSEKNQCHA